MQPVDLSQTNLISKTITICFLVTKDVKMIYKQIWIWNFKNPRCACTDKRSKALQVFEAVM